MVLLSIVVLVGMGGEVNDVPSRHVFLLTRQRLMLTNMATDPAVAHEFDSESLDSTTNAIDVLCADIAAQHEVHPVRLLGLYCGYSLLSTIYFIPAYVVSSVITYCLKK